MQKHDKVMSIAKSSYPKSKAPVAIRNETLHVSSNICMILIRYDHALYICICIFRILLCEMNVLFICELPTL